jgi:plasmid maintenance system killer protein
MAEAREAPESDPYRPQCRDPGAQMAMPGMRLHSLHGNRCSIWVDENYRVTFRFDRGHAYEVDYEDCH